MQIGMRWRVGERPPEDLAPALRQAVEDEERTLEELGADTGGWGWTLTFLEGVPIVTLDDGTVLHLADDGTVGVTREQPGD